METNILLRLLQNLQNFCKQIFKKTKSKIRSLRKPRFLTWNLFPIDGNPLTLSVYEFTFYGVIFVSLFMLFVAFNDIPHQTISVEANRLNDGHYVQTYQGNDSLCCLHYQRAVIELGLPLSSRVTNRFKDSNISLSGIILEDSVNLSIVDTIYFPGPYPLVPLEKRIINKTPLSMYWNVVFRRALYDSKGLKTAPNPNDPSTEGEYFCQIQDNYMQMYYRDRNHIDTLNRICNIIIPDRHFNSKNVYINNYAVSLNVQAGQNINPEFTEKHYEPWSVQRDSTNTIRYIIKASKGSTLCNKRADSYIARRSYDYKDTHHKQLFNRNSFNHEFNRLMCGWTSYGSRWIQDDSIMFDFRYSKIKEPVVVDVSNNHGWFTLNDISKGYYHIYLHASSIDSMQFTINLPASLITWLSVEPNDKSATFLKYSSPEKILQIKNEGLHLFYESNEFAKKQSVRVFLVTAVLSGLIIILLTFIILGIYRAIRRIRTDSTQS